jgi:hypothetical protein
MLGRGLMDEWSGGLENSRIGQTAKTPGLLQGSIRVWLSSRPSLGDLANFVFHVASKMIAEVRHEGLHLAILPTG